MEKQWYFNTVTEQPELGMISPASHRMGPYNTREDALAIFLILRNCDICHFYFLSNSGSLQVRAAKIGN